MATMTAPVSERGERAALPDDDTPTQAPAGAAHVLVADDQPEVLAAMRLLLKMHGHAVTTAASPAAVLAHIRAQRRPFDVLLMDMNYARDTTSGREGVHLVARVHKLDPALPIVVMTAWSTVPLAVEVMREGAGDLVEKPWDNRQLLAAVETQVAEGRRRRRARRLEAEARDVQRQLLGRTLPRVEGYDLAVAWSAAEPLGGDAYAVAALPRGRLAVAIADVCGKGTPAALLMASARATLEGLVEAGLPPAALCAQLGRALGPRLGGGRFVSLVYAELNRAAGTLAYTNAGHPPPLLLSREGVRRLDGGGPVLGVLADARYEEHVLPLFPGDRLALFTDGIVEAAPAAAPGEELGETRLLARLSELHRASASETARSVLALARDFADGRLADDATVLVVDAAGTASRVESSARFRGCSAPAAGRVPAVMEPGPAYKALRCMRRIRRYRGAL